MRKRKLESTDGSKGNCDDELSPDVKFEYKSETCNSNKCIGKCIYHI